ncbi:hypothetical protein GZH47_22430 [Paenibacillus rhizovicinus]|uniref:FixH family protein n=1 Tax=Paenibacillus rhizovicinus TaxID=2704463 RepID=A0A6C0P6D5_9BACL|nr:hypothetical protein [Paenibacillus rhizovicinus]QHW33273.1 hypothetical protein GZH47_22430 [Paenibacillus rhizovicinus]
MAIVAQARRIWSAAGLLAAILLLGGCGSGTMSGVDVHPPTKGLLHYLQQAGQMGNVSDRGYRVTAEAEDGQPSAGAEAALTLQVSDASGRPVQAFADDMTKLMHFIVVSKDLSEFQHLHPEYEGQGKFSVKLTFPRGGPFLLVSEFMPDGKGLTVYKQWMDVSGGGTGAAQELEAADATQNALPTVTVNGLDIKLTAMPQLNELKAGEMVMLAFSVRKAGTDERIVLEPYLGTAGHCVILDEKAEQYLHVHAAAEMSTGSSVMFHAEFPKAGVYKLWAQFQYEGQVVTAPFVLRVV